MTKSIDKKKRTHQKWCNTLEQTYSASTNCNCNPNLLAYDRLSDPTRKMGLKRANLRNRSKLQDGNLELTYEEYKNIPDICDLIEEKE